MTVDEDRANAWVKEHPPPKWRPLAPRKVPEKGLPGLMFVKPLRCTVCGKNPPGPGGDWCGACTHRILHRPGCGCPHDAPVV